MDDFALATVPTGPDEAEGPPPTNFYELQDNLHLDRADHITAMLDAAGKLDQAAKVRRGQRRALLATLTFAGLRIGEALSLQWRDVDLARGTITVRAAKTKAGERTVNILAVLRDELGEYRARLDPAPGALVFGSAAGRQQSASNIRRRVLAKTVEKANDALAKDHIEPLPENLTPHSLRRTYASAAFRYRRVASLCDGADGAHHTGTHAGDLRPPNGSPRRRARATKGTHRGA